jgi:hypothetical protein
MNANPLDPTTEEIALHERLRRLSALVAVYTSGGNSNTRDAATTLLAAQMICERLDKIEKHLATLALHASLGES